jgi:hypothetical protein
MLPALKVGTGVVLGTLEPDAPLSWPIDGVSLEDPLRESGDPLGIWLGSTMMTCARLAWTIDNVRTSDNAAAALRRLGEAGRFDTCRTLGFIIVFPLDSHGCGWSHQSA